MNIAVCVHLYYVEMFQEISLYLDNFGDTQYDLFFTIPRENKPFVPKIREKYPNAEIIVTENIGFDIFPFLCFLENINLDYYDVVFKLHSKKDIPIDFVRNNVDLSGTKWRDYMLKALLGTEARVQQVLRIFERHPHIGMLCAKEVHLRGQEQLSKDIDLSQVEKTMLDCGLLVRNWEFVAGSVFAIRPALLKPLKNRNYQSSDFPPYYPRNWNGLPYCLERVFGCLVSAQGQMIGDLPSL